MSKELVFTMLRKPLAIHRIFIEIAESLAGGVLLSQLYAWQPRDGSAFYKTVSQLKDECGLTRHEQAAAKKVLIAKKLIKIEKYGMPAKNYFSVCLDNLVAAIESAANKSAEFRLTGQPNSGSLSNIGTLPTDTSNRVPTPGAALGRLWESAWREKFGSSYKFSAADRAAAKRLAKDETGIEVIMIIARWAWDRVGGKDWDLNQSATIAGLASRWNAIVARYNSANQFENRKRANYETGKIVL